MTIYALASAPGRAAIAIVRVSGPATSRCLKGMIDGPLPSPRMASHRCLKDPSSGDALDDALVFWFPGPGSFTGEDCAELHLHGGRAVVQAVCDCLGRQAGLRPAEPGEFSRRAVVNGKLDLIQAEAIADLTEAATDRQRQQALDQLGGALSQIYEGWSERLSALLAHAEASIDFPDEDLPAEITARQDDEIAALIDEMRRHLDDGRRAERLRGGLSVAIVGPPNVGTSSLLNRLAQREAAIVSAEAGTTRDVVEVVMDIAGFEVVLADTAGLRDEAGAIEKEGIRRARELAARADVRLVVAEAANLGEAALPLDAMAEGPTVIVANKSDLAVVPRETRLGGHQVVPISCLTGAGLDDLVEALSARLTAIWPGREALAGPTRERHRSGVLAAVEALERARSASLPELAGEDLRLASRSLGRITGRVDVDDLLDIVFREFCIGK